MKKFLNKKTIILIVLTVIVALTAVISVKTENSFVSGVFGSVFAPVQKVFAGGIKVVKNTAIDLINSPENAKENKKLTKKVLELEGELRMLEGYKTENERLRGLLDFADTRKDVEYTAANIIGRSMSDISSIITIDKGSKHGVKKNSVVVIPEGIVGVVFEVSATHSKVKTIFDEESSVSAICTRSGDMGIVEGNLTTTSKTGCRMNYISNDAKIVVGDSIETSGTGGIFPKGILIGKVKSIKNDERNLNLSAVIETGVDINNIDTVMVSVN